MIVTNKRGQAPTDKFGKAGFDAEKQMAYKLKVAFEHSDDVFVFNDIRLEDKGHFAQIDHLVLHPFGFFLIESKSVSSQIEVNSHLEFVRVFNGRRRGMDSPIAQVKAQAEILGRLLNGNKEQLRRKVLFGLSQGQFSDERFETLVAISGRGEIIRKKCNPPELMKTDAVVERIRERISRRESLSGAKAALEFVLASKAKSDEMEKDKLFPFTAEELEKIRDFIATKDTPLRKSVPPKQTLPPPIPITHRRSAATPPPVTSKKDQTEHSCRHCDSNKVKVAYGKYGYYFKCDDCNANTKIDLTCKCGDKAKISKRGSRFNWKCDCGNEDLFFINAE